MKYVPYYEGEHPNWVGVIKRYRFENGYGASVIKAQGSYGWENDLWELAVLKFLDQEDGYILDYTTEITSDVLGNLTDQDVENTLNRIENLSIHK